MEKNDIKQALKDVKEFEHIGSFVMGVVVVVVLSSGVIYGLTKMKFQPFSFYTNPTPTPQVTPSISTVELKELPASPDLYEKDGQLYARNLPATYEVRQGDSSWKVALAVYWSGDNYHEIESENGMKSNQDLVVGQKIKLPNVPSKKNGVTPTTVPISTPQPTGTPTVSPPAQGGMTLPTKHTVQKSEGLWQIAEKYYNDGYKYMKIYEANTDKMRNPEDIQIGMELTIPQ